MMDAKVSSARVALGKLRESLRTMADCGLVPKKQLDVLKERVGDVERFVDMM